jgi:hypothetical protein
MARGLVNYKISVLGNVEIIPKMYVNTRECSKENGRTFGISSLIIERPVAKLWSPLLSASES